VNDLTPTGDSIDIHTLWLTFDRGEECAITLDLTRFNAAMGRLRAVSERRAARSRGLEGGHA